MNGNTRLEREILLILLEMSAGEAGDEQYARLDELVRTDPAARQYVVTGLTHLADLEWEVRVPGAAESTAPVEQVAARAAAASAISASDRQIAELATPARDGDARRARFLFSWAAVAASFALGVMATLWTIRERGGQFAAVPPVIDLRNSASDKPTIPIAMLVSNTSYMWDADAGVAMKTGDPLHAGKSVTLFDGVAEVQFEGGTSTRLKGPAILSIDSAGVPALKYGRIIASNAGENQFRLNIPLASALIPSNSYVGIDAYGEEAIVNVFEGGATLVPTSPRAKSIDVVAGEAVRLRKDARSGLSVEGFGASPKAYDFELLMATDRIDVSDRYVDLIKQDKPIAYWRFESADSSLVDNEAGSAHQLKLIGDDVRLVHRDGNGMAEFVIRESTGCLVATDELDELTGQDYAIELWVKPSHFQRGSLVSLVHRSSDELGSVERHGLILELNSASPTPEGRLKAIRFLHRSPPDELLTGTSCFSPGAYRTQIWQHIAAVKEGAFMRLYIDGQLVASAEDATQLSKGLSLVIGQLFSFGTVRPFVGHLDEVAVYDRALTAADVRRRVDLMRTTSHADQPINEVQ